MSYCSRQDLIDRLSQTGLLYLADDDMDSALSSPEQQASLDWAISAASGEIDAVLVTHVELPLAEENAWLKQRAIDLGAEHLMSRRGGDVSASLEAAAQRSRRWLEQVRKGELRVPGLTYPADRHPTDVRRTGLPRVSNPRTE